MLKIPAFQKILVLIPYKNGMDLSDVVKDDIDYKAVGEKYKNLKMVTDQYLKTVLKEIRKRV